MIVYAMADHELPSGDKQYSIPVVFSVSYWYIIKKLKVKRVQEGGSLFDLNGDSTLASRRRTEKQNFHFKRREVL